MMGFELVDLDDPEAIRALREMDPPRDPLMPQQLLIADALNAGNKRSVVEIPRRASKTTTILCWCLGRCASRNRYKVTYSAQTGSAGTATLDEWARDGLDRIAPPDEMDLAPWMRGRNYKPKAQTRHEALFGMSIETAEAAPVGRGFKVLKGNTKTGIYFDNGSSFVVLKPEAGAYRGKAADISWLDEAQEIDPEDGAALLAGIMPLQDTRPGSQIVISGTAGEAPVGPFWKFLSMLRGGNPTMGGIDFAADPDTDWQLLEDETYALDLLETVHPGVGTLTNRESMAENYQTIPLPQWVREYLSIWPESFGVKAIDPGLWDSRGLARKKPIPARVAFAMAIKPRGGVAAICAAWRDSKGIGYVELVAYQGGTGWMPERGQTLTTTYRGSTIAYDTISSEALATVTEMNRLRPKPRVRKQTWPELAAGCVQFMRDLENDKLRHFRQKDLTAATDKATRREVRGENGQWLWGADSTDDITPLIAATNALANWDKYYARAATAGPSTPIMGD
ncbi:hypothetical protein [Agreia sp. VKM Ac-1783]|uniref:hypothetical protein n=1 Tax=Agreia sp. VKM Ac-1783 TaxID=1938889 RepID=UPI000A2AAA69|nr:hypothetical protein [Agreia sp. VKM Ac-1783]SMQ73492.1 hypothetical protein SAMN06295943_2895 [Agreia sp. VKM Ac-1783]